MIGMDNSGEGSHFDSPRFCWQACPPEMDGYLIITKYRATSGLRLNGNVAIGLGAFVAGLST